MLRQLTTWWYTRFAERQPGQRSVGAALLIALLAIPIILACGITPRAITTAPARDISLTITINGQHATFPSTASSSVLVHVSFMVAGYRGSVILSPSHSLTCNGVPLNLTTGVGAPVPRQPPGGAYTFIYTDEQGRQTTLVVAVPSGSFAITSPATGATIALPRQPNLGPAPTAPTGTAFTQGSANPASLVALEATPAPAATLTPPQTAPTPAPNATPTPPATQLPSGTPTPVGQVRPPQLVSQPPILIRYTVPTLPTNGAATFQARARCGLSSGPPTCAGDVFGPTLTASGAYTLTDADVAPGYGFEAFVPGPGELDAQFMMTWMVPASGFNGARVMFYENATVPITWTR